MEMFLSSFFEFSSVKIRNIWQRLDICSLYYKGLNLQEKCLDQFLFRSKECKIAKSEEPVFVSPTFLSLKVSSCQILYNCSEFNRKSHYFNSDGCGTYFHFGNLE